MIRVHRVKCLSPHCACVTDTIPITSSLTMLLTRALPRPQFHRLLLSTALNAYLSQTLWLFQIKQLPTATFLVPSAQHPKKPRLVGGSGLCTPRRSLQVLSHHHTMTTVCAT